MDQGSLLDSLYHKPLAERLRPQSGHELIGQKSILGPGKSLYKVLNGAGMHSMVFWGPPGTGKTTLARILTNQYQHHYIRLSAVEAGVKEVRQAILEAKQHRARGTVLFIDEVHRFNKSQQDAFLPYIEDGTIFFIGATTENPSFELNKALLSRVQVYVFEILDVEDLENLITRVLQNEFPDIKAENQVIHTIARQANGDARQCLNILELCVKQAIESTTPITLEMIQAIGSGIVQRFDKGGDEFYNLISALHKSVRGSSPDAALYWFGRLIQSGCDENYIARRLVRMASEDIGNAEPRALSIAMDAWQAQERLGAPEGHLALAQAVCYLASVPKSNAVYTAYQSAMEDVAKYGSPPVPPHLCNAPTDLMKKLSYGESYRYAHDEPEAYAAGENYFPKQVSVRHYYQPTDRGLELKIKQRLENLRKLDAQWYSAQGGKTRE